MAEQWILDMTKKLQLPHDGLNEELYAKCIYPVPKILKDVNSQAYEPKFASFGPYHHECLHLRPMEQHKQRVVIKFLRRLAQASKTPEDVVVAMRNVESHLLASYDSLHIEYEEVDCLERSRFRHRSCCKEKDEFLMLMIVDGCFALEVMRAYKRYVAGEESEYDPRDCLFGTERIKYVMSDLSTDMLLLENQIPFLALTTLAAMDGLEIRALSTLIKTFFNVSSSDYEITEWNFHILDIYREILIGEGEYLPSSKSNVRSVTELRNAGVSFRKSNTKFFRDISFNGGILSLPPLDIDDTTEPLLLNLMAFERLHATAGNEVTAYAFFMDWIINTADDVALLRTEEIITGWVGCDEDIAKMFNRITKEETLFYSTDDKLRLNDYCKKRMHRWRASFVETYLKNPWVFTSLVGGLFLLALTIVQTMYTILQFYEKPSHD